MDLVELSAVAVVSAFVGGVIALVVARRVVARRRARAAAVPTLGQVYERTVQTTATGVAVVDRFQDLIVSNAAAVDLGLVRQRRLDEEVWAVANRVFTTGNPTEVDLTLRSGRVRDTVPVRCVARVLLQDSDRFVVVFGFDDSEQTRMEATRRDFVANISHELKTPIGAMALSAEALLESADDPDAVRHFGARLQAEATRLGKMVTELISLSRLQGAEKLPDLEPVSVDDIVDDAIRRTRMSADQLDVTVQADEPSDLVVGGDRTLLATAVTNLVDNAIAYSPPGSTVSVSRSRRGPLIAVSVTDRGVGIDKADQERVFERFFRVDKARSRSTGGTGLGLAIVKHIAANHNGEVTLWSKLGTGSTFTLLVPALDSVDDSIVDPDPQDVAS